MSFADELYEIADELRAIACQGLQFDSNPYARERYERVLTASARLVAVLEKRSEGEVLEQYRGNMQHFSPLTGAEAAVYREGRLLLIRRQDDGLWALPGGLTEVGETLAETACRELWEEASLRGQAVRLLGVFDSRLWQSRLKLQLYHVVFQVECGPAEPVAGPETTDARFFAPADLPPLSAGHHLRVPLILKMLQGEAAAPYLDGCSAGQSQQDRSP